MQSIPGSLSVLCFATILLTNVAYSQSNKPNPLDPFDPLWDQNVALFKNTKIIFKTLDLKGDFLGLNSGRKKLISNESDFEGATSISSDPTGFGFIVDLSGDYLFDFDKSLLKPEAQKALEAVLEMYIKYGGTSVTIEGHTDSKGLNDYNQKLSLRRATTVEDWFIANKIDKTLLSSLGLGETTPIAKNSINGKDNPDGRALNRRVEIKIKTTKKVTHLQIISR